MGKERNVTRIMKRSPVWAGWLAHEQQDRLGWKRGGKSSHDDPEQSCGETSVQRLNEVRARGK